MYLRTGCTVAMTVVYELPPSEFWSSRVSFESRYGTWLAPADGSSDMTTLPSAVRLVLMCSASFMRMPVLSDFLMRSEPARSTRLSLPLTASPVARSRCTTVMVKTVCERDETAFILVSCVARSLSPWLMTAITSSYDETEMSARSFTYTFPSRSSRIS